MTGAGRLLLDGSRPWLWVPLTTQEFEGVTSTPERRDAFCRLLAVRIGLDPEQDLTLAAMVNDDGVLVTVTRKPEAGEETFPAGTYLPAADGTWHYTGEAN